MTSPAPSGARRLRVPIDHLAPGDRPLPPETATYVARVHRLAPGDTFLAFDPEQALEADAHVLSVAPNARSVTVHFDPPRPANLRAPRPITLVQSLGKGDKMDSIVRDATELGATRILPVIAERTVARPDDPEARVRRWRKIATEAARQSGRGDTPTITPPEPLLAALATLTTTAPPARGVCLVPGAPSLLGDFLYTLPPGAPFTFVVGPEGGLSPAEITACEAAGLPAVSLSPLVLRTETVCAAVLGAALILTSRTPARASD